MPVKYRESTQGFKESYKNKEYIDGIKQRISKLQNLSQKDLLQAFSTNTDFLDRAWRYGYLHTQSRNNSNYHKRIDLQRDQIKEDYNTNYEKSYSIDQTNAIEQTEKKIGEANKFLMQELKRSQEDLKHNTYILDSRNNNIEYRSKEGVFIFTYNNQEKTREIPENYKKLLENYENYRKEDTPE